MIIFPFIMLTRTIFGSCQWHQRVKSQGRIERMPAGIFLLWIFLIKQWKNSHKTNLPMAFKPRCTYWNKGMIQTADLGNDWGMTGFSFSLITNGIKQFPNNWIKRKRKIPFFSMFIHHLFPFCSSGIDELEKRLAAMRNPWDDHPTAFWRLPS